MLLYVLGLGGLAHIRVSEGPITMCTLYNPDSLCAISSKFLNHPHSL